MCRSCRFVMQCILHLWAKKLFSTQMHPHWFLTFQQPSSLQVFHSIDPSQFSFAAKSHYWAYGVIHNQLRICFCGNFIPDLLSFGNLEKSFADHHMTGINRGKKQY